MSPFSLPPPAERDDVTSNETRYRQGQTKNGFAPYWKNA